MSERERAERAEHPVPCGCEYHRELRAGRVEWIGRRPGAWVRLPASSSLRRLGRRFIGRG